MCVGKIFDILARKEEEFHEQDASADLEAYEKRWNYIFTLMLSTINGVSSAVTHCVFGSRASLANWQKLELNDLLRAT